MVQHTREYSDGAGFCSGGFQDSRGLGTSGTGCQDIIDNQDALSLDGWRMRDGNGAGLIFESLSDGHAFLRSCSRCSLEHMDVARDLKSRRQFIRDDPRRIEIADKSLPPVLRDRHNPVE